MVRVVFLLKIKKALDKRFIKCYNITNYPNCTIVAFACIVIIAYFARIVKRNFG